jgi:hypothetical protein
MAALPLAGACAPALRTLPSGAGTPATDGARLFDEATRTCRDVRVLTADVAVSGHVGAGKVRGHLLAGVAAPDSLRLEGAAPFGPPVFVLVAEHGRGTLLLPRASRVLRDAQPAAIVDALAGVTLSPSGLLAILSGCGAPEAPVTGVQAYGGDWVRADQQGGAAVYVHREQNGWRIVSALLPQPDDKTLRVDYTDFSEGRPDAIRLIAPSSDLRLQLSQVDINTTLPARAFTIDVPAAAEPITLDELRQSGLLGGAR